MSIEITALENYYQESSERQAAMKKLKREQLTKQLKENTKAADEIAQLKKLQELGHDLNGLQLSILGYAERDASRQQALNMLDVQSNPAEYVSQAQYDEAVKNLKTLQVEFEAAKALQNEQYV